MWYLLYRAAQEGRTVVLASKRRDSAIFRHGKAFKIDDIYVRGYPEVQDPRAVFIAECQYFGTSMHHAFHVMFTDAKRSTKWKWLYESHNNEFVTLPSFDNKEILELRTAAFASKPGCSVEEVGARLAKWGGNTRNVLARPDKRWQDHLEACAGAFDVATLERLTGASAIDKLRGNDEDDDYQYLTRLVTAGTLPGAATSTADAKYCSFEHAELATPYVVDAVVAQLQRRSSPAFAEFLTVERWHPAVEAVRDAALRRMIIAPRMSAGAGQLPLARLSTASKALPQPEVLKGATLDLRAPLPLVEFTTANDLAVAWESTEGDALFMGPHATLPLVDYVLRLGGQPLLISLSTTVLVDSPEREAAFNALLAAVGLGSPDASVPLLILRVSASAHQYADTERKLNTKWSSWPDKIYQAPVLDRVVQYKVLLEWPEWRP